MKFKVLRDGIALFFFLSPYVSTHFCRPHKKQSILTKRGVRESSQMAWNGLRVKCEPAAWPGDVGLVYILTPQKLVVGGKKISRYDLQTPKPLRIGAEPPWPGASA